MWPKRGPVRVSRSNLRHSNNPPYLASRACKLKRTSTLLWCFLCCNKIRERMHTHDMARGKTTVWRWFAHFFLHLQKNHTLALLRKRQTRYVACGRLKIVQTSKHAGVKYHRLVVSWWIAHPGYSGPSAVTLLLMGTGHIGSKITGED